MTKNNRGLLYRKLGFVFYCLILSNLVCWGQHGDKEYLVVTFERSHGSSKELCSEHFWIMSYEEAEECEIYPLAFICKGSMFWPNEVDDTFLHRIHYPANDTIPVLQADAFCNRNGWSYKELVEDGIDYDSLQDSFLKLVLSNRIEVLRYSKRWKRRMPYIKGWTNGKKKKETITVYVTPIRGYLKKGWTYNYDSRVLTFAGLAYYIDSPVWLDDGFSNSSLERELSYLDFSYIDFSKYTSLFHSEDEFRLSIIKCPLSTSSDIDSK